MELPDLVTKAVISACNLGRKLSWEIQESEKGTLIQLVWKAVNSFTGKSEVCSNWNMLPTHNCQTIVQKPQRRNHPSRVRRNARRLKAFIERTQTTQDCREVSENGKYEDGGNTGNSSAKADATASPGMVPVLHHQPSHAHPTKLKLSSLSPDLQETVRTSVASELPELVQKTLSKLPSSPPDPQKTTSAIMQLRSPVFRL